jgi:hypothetical protein
VRRWVAAGAVVGVIVLAAAVAFLRSGGSPGQGHAASTPTSTATAVAIATPLPSVISTAEAAGPAASPSPTPVSTATTTGAALACGTLPLGFTSPLPAGTPIATTAVLGTVTARLTGQVAPDTIGDPSMLSVVLTVAESGVTVLTSHVGPPKDEVPSVTDIIPWDIGPTTGPSSNDTNETALCLADFPGQSMPTVLLGLDLGGAHCCTVVRAYQLIPGGVASPVDDDLGNPGASLQTAGGSAIIVTADNAFAYTFDSFAGSGMPVMVLGFSGGRFVNLTTQHLDRVQTDAAYYWGLVNQPSTATGDLVGLGLLAPWVADECLLGQETHAWATVAAFEAQGRLGPTANPAGAWPTGADYVSALRTFLRQHGYCA